MDARDAVSRLRTAEAVSAPSPVAPSDAVVVEVLPDEEWIAEVLHAFVERPLAEHQQIVTRLAARAIASRLADHARRVEALLVAAEAMCADETESGEVCNRCGAGGVRQPDPECHRCALRAALDGMREGT